MKNKGFIYEDQYSPKKLGNWEYPKWYPERPRQRFKSTKIIADDNGRLLEGIKRENPWGNYVGTWDLPRRITRDYGTVNKLVAPPERVVKLWENKKIETETQQLKPEAPSEEVAPVKEEKEKAESFPIIDHNSNSSAEKSFQKRNKSSSALDFRPRPTKLEPLAFLERKNEKLHDIKPGSSDDKIKNILDSVQEAKEKQVEPTELICKEIKALPKRSKVKAEAVELNEEQKADGKGKRFLKCLNENLEKYETDLESGEELKIDLTRFEKPEENSNMENRVKTPENKASENLKPGSSGFQIAKRFHDENLRHKPLPDVIADPVYKALNSGKQTNSEQALNVTHVPTAIGWKPYSAPRPTECSKLKVFRPKTGAEKAKLQKDFRPKTGDFSVKKRFLPIDLAICWDLKPDDPSDEPKRSPHIDGSNGSVAPAVFTMINPTEPEEPDQNVQGSSQAMAERITKGIEENNAAALPSQRNGKTRNPVPVTSNKEAILTCIKSSDDTQKRIAGTPESLNSISPNAAEFARRHPKTAWTREDTSKALSDRLQSLQKQNCLIKNWPSRSSSESSQKKYQSTPNLAAVCESSHCGTKKSSPGSANHSKSNLTDGVVTGKRLKNERKKQNCSACKQSGSDSNENGEKNEFKAAFKAGVPRSESTNSGSSLAAKSYKVPKVRLPYAKRSYTIGTLAPPFSLWRENNGQEYPDHWRLASVYQHSYKPINFRKRPLLATVYQ